MIFLTTVLIVVYASKRVYDRYKSVSKFSIKKIKIKKQCQIYISFSYYFLFYFSVLKIKSLSTITSHILNNRMII